MYLFLNQLYSNQARYFFHLAHLLILVISCLVPPYIALDFIGLMCEYFSEI